MKLNEVTISKAIVTRYFDKLMANIETDVAIVGGGPSGIVAGYYLAMAGFKTVLFERKLSIGGGMWGGGMMFNEIVVQDLAVRILDEFGIRHRPYDKGYHTADSIESVSTLISKSTQAGLTIFNCISVEDVLMRPEKITGLVINWSPVSTAGLHIDPLTTSSQFVVDATGHATEVVKIVQSKMVKNLLTPDGKIAGEKSMWAEQAETMTLENTKEVYNGLYVSGMAANATFGGPRMGPIFGGMLLSGEKVAEELIGKLK